MVPHRCLKLPFKGHLRAPVYLNMTKLDTNPMRISCFPPRTYAHPAPHVECVWVGEDPPKSTRTALVLGVKVEIPLKARTP